MIELANDTLTSLTDTIAGNNHSSNDQLAYSIKLLLNFTVNSIGTSATQLMSKSQSSKVSHHVPSSSLMEHPLASSSHDDDLNLNPLANDSSTFSINLFDLASPSNLNSSSNQFSIMQGPSIASTLEDLTSKLAPSLPSSPSSTGAECASHHDITTLDVSSIQFPGNYSKVLEAEYSYIEYIKITFTLAVIIAALAGNIGIILAISLHRSLRTTINYYLVNLAIADIFICTFCMSVYLINHLTEPLFILGPVVCKLNAFCQSE